MKKPKHSIDKPVNKNIAAMLIGIVAILFPAYWLDKTDWENAELNVLAILLPLLYVIFVIGFVLLALGKKGKNITSDKTDRHIEKTYSHILKKLKPLWWVMGIAWCIWVAYLVWALSIEA